MPLFRRSARISAVVVAAMMLFLAGGEIFSPHSARPAHLREWMGLGLLLVTIAGMFVAFKWETRGALLSLAGIVSFVVFDQLHRLGVIAVLAAPGVLFLADAWIRSRRITD